MLFLLVRRIISSGPLVISDEPCYTLVKRLTGGRKGCQFAGQVARRDPAHDFLRRSNVEQIIDEECIYASIYEAVEALQSHEWGEL